MPSTIAQLFRDCRHEEVVRETELLLQTAPGNVAAICTQAAARYHLGEYHRAVTLLQGALGNWIDLEPAELRAWVTAILSDSLLELGRYGETLDLAEREDARAASATQLAGAWAATFERKIAPATELTARVLDGAGDQYTRGRAALCRALIARLEQDSRREARFLYKAQEELERARPPAGEPAGVVTLFHAQARILLDGDGALLDQVAREAEALPANSAARRSLEEAVRLHRSSLEKAPLESTVQAAIAAGVKRVWLASLPGAHLRGTVAPAAVAIPAAPEPVEKPAAETPPPAETPPAPAAVAPTAPEPVPEKPAVAEVVGTPAPVAAAAVKDSPWDTEGQDTPPPMKAVAAPIAAPTPEPATAPAPPPAEPIPWKSEKHSAPAKTETSPPSESTPVGTKPPAPWKAAAPQTPAAPAKPKSEDNEASGGRSRTHGILIVEPDDAVIGDFENLIADSPFYISEQVKNIDRIMDKKFLMRFGIVVIDVMVPSGSKGGNVKIDGVVQQILSLLPQTKIVILHTATNKYLVQGGLREGAVGRIPQPFEKGRVLTTLGSALTATSSVETLGGMAIQLKRTVACSWKTAEKGLFAAMAKWKPFLAHTIDPKGVEVNLDYTMKVGQLVLLQIEITGGPKPIETPAEVVSCKQEPNKKLNSVRFSFTELQAADAARVKGYIVANMTQVKR